MDHSKLAKMQASVRIGTLNHVLPLQQSLTWNNRVSRLSSSSCRIRDQSYTISGRTCLTLPLSGKGTVRRKIKKVHKSSGTDEKKLQATLKKLNVQPIQAIEEVNMFKEDGNVIHFSAPKVHSAISSNLFAIYGNAEEKELTELVPGILNQLGPDSLASLRKLAETYKNMEKLGGGKDDDDDDEIPNLVEGESFESKAAEVE